MALEKHRRQSDTWLSYVIWWNVVLHIVLIIVGVLGGLWIQSEGFRWGWFGLFVGAGLTGLITEILSVQGRREEAEQHRQLLEPARSRARSAYRIGEFYFPFAAAIEKRRLQDRHVVEVLNCSGPLGISDTVKSMVNDVNPNGPKFFAEVDAEFMTALAFVGEDTGIFYALGKDLFALRGDGAKQDEEARKTVSVRVGDNLALIEAYTNPTNISEAWQGLVSMWNDGGLDDEAVDELLKAVHTYLLTLGADQFGSGGLTTVINRLARVRVRVRGSSHPDVIDELVAEIRDQLAPR